MKSYDDRQAAAVRVRCVTCLREFYATKPAEPFVCQSCQ